MTERTPTQEVLRMFSLLVIGYWNEKLNVLRKESIQKNEKALALMKEKENLVSLMKKANDSPPLLESLKKEYQRLDTQCTAAKMKRNTTEVEECDAETAVGYCSYFLQNATELWRKALVQDQYRLQSLPFLNGVRHDDLQNNRTPEESIVYAALEKVANGSQKLAAPRRIELRLAD